MQMSNNQDSYEHNDSNDESRGFGLTTEQKKVCRTIHLDVHLFFSFHKTRLTSQAHHIASEQKRRENIRREFDRIVDLTPTLSDLERRSELNILTKSADFIDHLRFENAQLVQLCEARNILVPTELRYCGPHSDGSEGYQS